MTLDQIEQLPTDVLMPKDIACYLNSTENTINSAAKAGTLPWAYKMGKRTVIPKEAFVHYHKYGQVAVKM